MTCTSPHLPLWSVSFVNPWGPSAVIGPDLVTWWRHWVLIGPYQLWIWGWAWKLQWSIHPHPQDISRLELTQPSQAEDEIKLGKLKYLFFSHWNTNLNIILVVSICSAVILSAPAMLLNAAKGTVVGLQAQCSLCESFHEVSWLPVLLKL